MWSPFLALGRQVVTIPRAPRLALFNLFFSHTLAWGGGRGLESLLSGSNFSCEQLQLTVGLGEGGISFSIRKLRY